MTEQELIEIAKVVYAEGSVFSGKNQNALCAIAQCIHDLLPLFNNDLSYCLEKAFTTPSDEYDDNSLNAVRDVFVSGKRRYTNAEILAFRSFKKYSDRCGYPNFEKLSSVLKEYIYLGSDSISKEWGHFYFGRRINMSFRMLVMAGHGQNVDGSWDPGACGCEYQEADLTRELTQLISLAANRAGISCDVAPDRNHYSYFKNGGTYDFTPYNYVLEVHFNAGGTNDYNGDGNMRGSMVYIDQSETGHSVEDAILNNLYSIGSKQAWDGVVVTQRQWSEGLMVQNRVRAQGVSHAVLETCFVNDRDDMDWYQVNKSDIATAIVAGIQEGFKLNYSGTSFPYEVKVTDPALNIRAAAGTDSEIVGQITDMGVYHIVAESNGTGATKWGKLQSGAGWISLDFVKKL